MAQINSDIYTHVATEISKFMMGESELNDDTWNAYVAEVEAMGLDELQSFYETAYGRYESR